MDWSSCNFLINRNRSKRVLDLIVICNENGFFIIINTVVEQHCCCCQIVWWSSPVASLHLVSWQLIAFVKNEDDDRYFYTITPEWILTNKTSPSFRSCILKLYATVSTHLTWVLLLLISFKTFVNTRFPLIYRLKINEHSARWPTCIDNMGVYFEKKTFYFLKHIFKTYY